MNIKMIIKYVDGTSRKEEFSSLKDAKFKAQTIAFEDNVSRVKLFYTRITKDGVKCYSITY